MPLALAPPAAARAFQAASALSAPSAAGPAEAGAGGVLVGGLRRGVADTGHRNGTRGRPGRRRVRGLARAPAERERGGHEEDGSASEHGDDSFNLSAAGLARPARGPVSIIGTLAAPPATIGRYELRERIAHGGMGVLYLAFDPVTERQVALKVLRVDSDDLRERFLREARLAARLQHPNIVTIYDVGAHEDQPFIAMEFIAGETLGQLVHRRAPLTLSRRIALMEQVCVGLAYAHRHGIVHRDVKPANLMISRDSGVLKVLDFGVAGRVDADPVLQGQMLMGTPNYMSPEQVVGQASDHRSDIFSVGLVLYELLTYRQAFSGESQQSILLKVLNESPQPLAALVPGIDPALPAILDRALEKSVERRYPDLEAMRSDLLRVGQRVHATETSQDLVGRGTVAARGRGRAGRAPAKRPTAGPLAKSGEEPVSGPGSEPRHEPTSELSPGLSLSRARGPDSRRTSWKRWRRPSATPTRDASPPRSAGSRRSDRTPTSTPRCSTTDRPSPPVTRPAPRARRG